MTAREDLVRKNRRFGVIAPIYVISVGAIMICPLLATLYVLQNEAIDSPWFWITLFGFPLFGGLLLAIGFLHIWGRMRCPWCLKGLMFLIGGIESGSVNYCPSCGESLDKKVPLAVKLARDAWADELA